MDLLRKVNRKFRSCWEKSRKVKAICTSFSVLASQSSFAGKTKIQMLAAICSIENLIHWNLVNLSHICLQVRTLFLQWLPWILRMQRPGKPITRKTIMMTNRMRELELKEKTSKSLLANVLDMDDDFRLVSPFSFNKASISESELRPTPCSDF